MHFFLINKKSTSQIGKREWLLVTLIQLRKHALLLVQDQHLMDTEASRRVVKQIYVKQLVIKLYPQMVQLPSINLITRLLISFLTCYLLFY
jgi:hypothetical protein